MTWPPEPTAQAEIDEFFRAKKKPAAILKHAVLAHYLPVFAAKTGMRSRDHQVVVVDGYAGAGRYSPGDAGSPALIAQTSLASGLRQRRLRALLVEANADTYRRLTQVMESEPAAETFTYQTYHGTVQGYLPALLDQASGLPLLMFLDPYGLGPDAAELTAIFASRTGAVGSTRQHPTEVLLRLDARFVSLVRGHLLRLQRGEGTNGTASLIRRMDRLVGGPWWQEGSHLNDVAFKHWFIAGYVDHLRTAIHGFAHHMPVTQSIGGDVKYYLVFLTLRQDGFFTFLETTSGAFQEWRRELRDRPEDVFDPEDIAHWNITDEQMLAEHQESEDRLAAEWIQTLQQNIRSVLHRTPTFMLVDEYSAVFGDLLGYARTTHLRAALQALRKAGELTGDLTRDLWFKTITATTSATV